MKLAAGMLIDGGAELSPQKYTQPVSVPDTTTNFQPLRLGDARLNDFWLAANPAIATAIRNAQANTGNGADAKYDQKVANDMLATVTAANLPNVGVSTEDTKITTTQDPSGSTSTKEQTATSETPLDAGNGSFIPSSTTDTLTSDAADIPQPEAAIPPPVYALDSASNLYIDINSFIKNSDGTYTANLIFDPVIGAIKYNYRISATS